MASISIALPPNIHKISIIYIVNVDIAASAVSNFSLPAAVVTSVGNGAVYARSLSD